LRPITFILDVSIISFSAHPPIVVDTVWIRAPWAELHVDWAENAPYQHGSSLFEVDGQRGMKFERRDVINQRLFRAAGLKFGIPLRGLLIGSAVSHLPLDYQRGKVSLQLWVCDQLGGEHCGEIVPIIDWSPGRVRLSNSKGLFEPEEASEVRRSDDRSYPLPVRESDAGCRQGEASLPRLGETGSDAPSPKSQGRYRD